jgi:hypothetical protein
LTIPSPHLATGTLSSSSGRPLVASREWYVTPSVDGLSMAKQYTPSPGIAPVTSNVTASPAFTAPCSSSTGPSIAGRVAQVSVPSPHPQSEIA